MARAVQTKKPKRGRRLRRAAAKDVFVQPPRVQPQLPWPPIKVLSDDQVEAIHNASLDILEEIGMDILGDEARSLYKQAGADVTEGSERVRFDRSLVESFIGLAPEITTIHARNPEHSVILGGKHIIYCPVGSPPNCSDLDNGRRPGTRRDYCNFMKIIQSLNTLHLMSGYPVEPVDIHPSIRHLDALHDALTLTDKPIFGYSLGLERILDAFEMVRIACGLSADTMREKPCMFSTINTSSPLRLDVPMGIGIIELARHGQVAVLTPFTLSGAMAPVTLAGALAQQNAEALACVVLSQTARPGAPVAYGGFTSNVDMKSGAPAFGTPEYMKAAVAGGQMARRYRLPYRSSNVNAANSLDMQAAYESVFSLWSTVMGGVNMMKHAAGWMEGGLCASFEKMIIDADTLNMVTEFLSPAIVNDEELAMDAIREVGPGGHFFGCAHTQARYQTAFFSPLISNWTNYEAWVESGSPEAPQRANRIYHDLVDHYEPPPMDAAIRDELDAFVARRKEEGGAPTDF